MIEINLLNKKPVSEIVKRLWIKPAVKKTMTLPEKALERLTVIKANLLSYAPESNIHLIEKAFALAVNFHKDLCFKDGEPYYLHELRFANFLTELQMKDTFIAAALAHKVPADLVEISLGKGAADILRAKNALDAFTYDSKKGSDQQLYCFNAMLREEENLNIHLFVAADIYQTMLTSATKDEKLAKQEYVERALDVIAPFLKRLDYKKTGEDLENAAFFILQPEKYKKYEALVKKHTESIDLKSFEDIITNQLKLNNLNAKSLSGIKREHSIYDKIEVRKKADESSIDDINRMRFVFNSIPECYEAEPMIMTIMNFLGWQFNYDKRKNYIKEPKDNTYQSLHLKFSKGDLRIEIQVRTEGMDDNAEGGEASHPGYKRPDIPWVNIKDKSAIARFNALRQNIIDECLHYVYDKDHVLHEIMTSSREEMSTPLDLAFAMNDEAGFHLAGAQILAADGWKDINIGDGLENGAIINIMTSKDAVPTKGRQELANSPYAIERLGVWLISPEKTISSRRETERIYREMGRERLAAKLAALELTNASRMESTLERRDAQASQIETLFSLNDLSARLGLRAKNNLLVRLGMSEEPKLDATSIVLKLMETNITAAYQKSGIKDGKLDLFLLYKYKLGLLKPIREILAKTGMSFSQFRIEPVHRDALETKDSDGDFFLQKWGLLFEDESSFKDLLDGLKHVHSMAERETQKFHKNPATVEIIFKEIPSPKITTKILDTILLSGAHIYLGGIGKERMATLKIRVPAVKKSEFLPMLRKRLQEIEGVENAYVL